MEGDPRVDELMLPVKAAIERHIKDCDAKTDVYNRVYEALMEIMDALDVSAQVTAKQIAESAKNLQRAEAGGGGMKVLVACEFSGRVRDALAISRAWLMWKEGEKNE